MEKHIFSIDALSTSEVGDLEFRQALGVEALVIISFEANKTSVHRTTVGRSP